MKAPALAAPASSAEPRPRPAGARRRRARARQLSTGSRRNLDGLDHDVEIVEGLVRAMSACTTLFAAWRSCSSLGALGSVPRSVQVPLTSSAVNVEGTLNVQLAARDEGVRRVVFASSSSSTATRTNCRCASRCRLTDLAVRRREARGGALLRELPVASTTRSRQWSCATSTSSGRARTPHRSTPPSCRSSSPRSPWASQ